MVTHLLLFGGSLAEGFFLWFTSEVVNYTAFLPLLLTLPSRPAAEFAAIRRWMAHPDLRDCMPLVALAASAAGGLIMDGPGALAFPVPALLWCALRYNLFATACLAFLYAIWTLLTIRTGLMSVGADFASRPLLISTRVGVSLIALTPLVVASVMAARNELLEQLRFLADHDALTGLRNRRAFLEDGGAALAASVSDARPAAVMMLDIDFFKSINDRYGHAAGDHVLVSVANLLRNNMRPQDTVGRLGGDEFSAVLPDCDLPEATSVAQRINEALRSTAIVLEGGDAIAVTVSIGVHVERHERDLDRLLGYADKALYLAKAAGRDQCEPSCARVAG